MEQGKSVQIGFIDRCINTLPKAFLFGIFFGLLSWVADMNPFTDPLGALDALVALGYMVVVIYMFSAGKYSWWTLGLYTAGYVGVGAFSAYVFPMMY